MDSSPSDAETESLTSVESPSILTAVDCAHLLSSIGNGIGNTASY